MRINSNIQALNAWRQVNRSDAALSRSLERLSSGLRINRAGDDAAGLAVSERMRSHIRSLGQAIRNAQDGISLLQVAEGALQEDSNIVLRLRELALQAASDTLTDSDRQLLQREVTQLVDELERIALTVEFNKTVLLDGSFSGKRIYIGVSVEHESYLRLSFSPMTPLALSLRITTDISITISTQTGAIDAITRLDTALDRISAERATMGAWQNRLEHATANLAGSLENLTAAESRIRDADMAAEVVQFTKNQILIQSGMVMLAHANIKPQTVLQLLA